MDNNDDYGQNDNDDYNDNLNDGDQNDDDNEGQENLAFLPADHPLLERLQLALTKQLTNEHQRIHYEWVEKTSQKKALEKDKVDVGVKLYGVQQQLADNQIVFEQAQENLNLVKKLRTDEESNFNVVFDKYQEKKKEVDSYQQKYFKTQDELSRLNRTLKQIFEYNQEIMSGIEITKRGTLTAEEDVQRLEKVKKKQDFLLDSMSEEVKKLQEQKQILSAQCDSQDKELDDANKILEGAQSEMETLIMSKKDLMEKWQKALAFIFQMDKALRDMRETIKVQEEERISLRNEIDGVDNELRKENIVHAEKLANLDKLKKTQRFLATQKEQFEDERNKLEAKLVLLNHSHDITDNQNKELETDNKVLQEQMTNIENNIMKLYQQTKNLNEQWIHEVNNHKTIEKSAANLIKQAAQIRNQNSDKDVELANLQNEYQRVQIDKLNTDAQIEFLTNKKNEELQDKEDKEAQVETFKTQIHQGHDLNEKKQHEVGRLNKQHDQCTSSSAGENLSQEEAKINRILQEIEVKEKEIEQFEKEWTKNQNILVTKTNDYNQIYDEVEEITTKQVILKQKKLRLQRIQEQFEKDIKEIQNQFKNLQTQMNRLNDYLAVHRGFKMKLEAENQNNESEFTQRLKQLESESVELEVQIDNLRQEKADLLTQIVELERQILLWERKINLEKEMQLSINPKVGQDDIHDLKKDIHRMQLRLDDIRIKQERIIKEIEREVYKRETIDIKIRGAQTVGAKNNKKKDLSKPSQLQGQMKNLKSTLNNTTKSANQIDQQIKFTQSEQNNINEEIDQQYKQLEQRENSVYELNNSLAKLKIYKLINIFQISASQAQSKKFGELSTNSAKLPFSEAILNKKFTEESEKKNQISQAIINVLAENPQYDFILSTLIDFQDSINFG